MSMTHVIEKLETFSVSVHMCVSPVSPFNRFDYCFDICSVSIPLFLFHYLVLSKPLIHTHYHPGITDIVFFSSQLHTNTHTHAA